jgi:hypothetical protein
MAPLLLDDAELGVAVCVDALDDVEAAPAGVEAECVTVGVALGAPAVVAPCAMAALAEIANAKPAVTRMRRFMENSPFCGLHANKRSRHETGRLLTYRSHDYGLTNLPD